MLESLRARLLLWYSLILILLIAIYAGTVTYLYGQSLIADVEADLSNTAGTIGRALVPDADGTFDLNFPPDFRETAFGTDADATYYAIWDARGSLVDQSGATGLPVSMPPPGVVTRNGRRELVVDAPGPSRVLVGRPLNPVAGAVRALGLTVAGVGALVLLLSLAGGWFLAGRALAPVARISRTAGAMIGGDLNARIPVKDTDSELEQVARALNEAFDRMRIATDLQRQFTADASHEFRTPLATLRAEFDWALKNPRTAEEYRGSIHKGRKAVDRMTEIAARLLLLLKSEQAGEGAARRSTLEVSALVAVSVELIAPLAEVHGVTIHTDLQGGQILGEQGPLVDALSNLLKNAVQYNHPGGEVFVRAWPDAVGVTVSVRDTGIGIDAADQPRVFERFYRAERSRSRDAGGAGLGLAIVKKIVEDHGGRVTCSSTAGAGTEFIVRLPHAAAGSAPQ